MTRPVRLPIALLLLGLAAVGAGCPGPVGGPMTTGIVAFKEPPLSGNLDYAPGVSVSPTPRPDPVVVSTYAGGDAPGRVDGERLAARLTSPTGLAFDARGTLYFSSGGDHSIRMVKPEGEVITVAGDLDGYADGPARDARFRDPRGLAVDAAGNVFVADTGNHRLRKIAPDGTVSTVAGGWSGFKDGPAAEAQFSSPSDVAFDQAGNLLIADTDNKRIRVLSPGGHVSTLANGDFRPIALAIDRAGTIHLVDEQNQSVRKLDVEGRVSAGTSVSTVIEIVGPPPGTPANGPVMFGWTSAGPRDIAIGRDGSVFVAVSMRVYSLAPGDTTPVVVAGYPFDEAPNEAAYAEATDGRGLTARFRGANSLAMGPDGALYVGDQGNHRIRRIAWEK